jgi:hypothetical protein
MENNNKEIFKIEGGLAEKEKLLNAIKDSQKRVQNQLLEAMKNEYHKKIITLESEIKNLEKEKGEALRKRGGIGSS